MAQLAWGVSGRNVFSGVSDTNKLDPHGSAPARCLLFSCPPIHQQASRLSLLARGPAAAALFFLGCCIRTCCRYSAPCSFPRKGLCRFPLRLVRGSYFWPSIDIPHRKQHSRPIWLHLAQSEQRNNGENRPSFSCIFPFSFCQSCSSLNRLLFLAARQAPLDRATHQDRLSPNHLDPTTIATALLSPT